MSPKIYYVKQLSKYFYYIFLDFSYCRFAHRVLQNMVPMSELSPEKMVASIDMAGEPDQKKNQRKDPKKIRLKLYLKRNNLQPNIYINFHRSISSSRKKSSVSSKIVSLPWNQVVDRAILSKEFSCSKIDRLNSPSTNKRFSSRRKDFVR